MHIRHDGGEEFGRRHERPGLELVFVVVEWGLPMAVCLIHDVEHGVGAAVTLGHALEVVGIDRLRLVQGAFRGPLRMPAARHQRLSLDLDAVAAAECKHPVGRRSAPDVRVGACVLEAEDAARRLDRAQTERRGGQIEEPEEGGLPRGLLFAHLAEYERVAPEEKLMLDKLDVDRRPRNGASVGVHDGNAEPAHAVCTDRLVQLRANGLPCRPVTRKIRHIDFGRSFFRDECGRRQRAPQRGNELLVHVIGSFLFL